MITQDGSYRRGSEIKLKPGVDEALQQCPTVQHVIVYKRTGTHLNMVAGRDQWWHNLMADASTECPAEPLDSEHPLYLLYTSGTTGKPITGPYTAGDLEQWTNCMARALYAHGVRSSDICQNSYGMGLFTGGLGVHQGATCIGAAVIPIASGQTERQIIIMKDFGTTVLSSTPTYALTIAEKAEEMGINLRDLPLRIGSFGAESNKFYIKFNYAFITSLYIKNMYQSGISV